MTPARNGAGQVVALPCSDRRSMARSLGSGRAALILRLVRARRAAGLHRHRLRHGRVIVAGQRITRNLTPVRVLYLDSPPQEVHMAVGGGNKHSRAGLTVLAIFLIGCALAYGVLRFAGL